MKKTKVNLKGKKLLSCLQCFVPLTIQIKYLKLVNTHINSSYVRAKRKPKEPKEWWGRNEDLNIVERSSNYDQGTTTTHTTLQVKSEFIWFSSYRDIGQKRNSHTKSLKNSISRRRIRLLDLLTSSLGLLWWLRVRAASNDLRIATEHVELFFFIQVKVSQTSKFNLACRSNFKHS